jgi:hypothetical protein
MSFNEILAELPKLTENEKRQLLNLLSHELNDNADPESPEFLTMLEARICAADSGGRTHTLAEAREAVKNTVKRARR